MMDQVIGTHIYRWKGCIYYHGCAFNEINYFDTREPVRAVDYDEFLQWCADNDVELRLVCGSDSNTTYLVALADDDQKFAFKMRWDLG